MYKPGSHLQTLHSNISIISASSLAPLSRPCLPLEETAILNSLSTEYFACCFACLSLYINEIVLVCSVLHLTLLASHDETETEKERILEQTL